MFAPLDVFMRVTLFAVRILNKKKLLFDFALIFLAIAIGALLLIAFELGKVEGETVAVIVGGEVVCEYKLSENGRYEINGGTNILVVKDGAAYVEWASCPDGLCKKQGEISMVDERIVCLPNKVIIEIR